MIACIINKMGIIEDAFIVNKLSEIPNTVLMPNTLGIGMHINTPISEEFCGVFVYLTYIAKDYLDNTIRSKGYASALSLYTTLETAVEPEKYQITLLLSYIDSIWNTVFNNFNKIIDTGEIPSNEDFLLSISQVTIPT